MYVYKIYIYVYYNIHNERIIYVTCAIFASKDRRFSVLEITSIIVICNVSHGLTDFAGLGTPHSEMAIFLSFSFSIFFFFRKIQVLSKNRYYRNYLVNFV